MRALLDSAAGRFCWVDLAAADEAAAHGFYGRLFDWTTRVHRLGDGSFTRFCLADEEIASVYQLSRRHRNHGVPSHWTPYVAVADAERTAARAAALGATVVVKPFDVPGIARIALVEDPIGALFGLWEPGSC
jgi:hypothetical protein